MARKNNYTIAIDKLIGSRVRERRITMGLTRQQLAEKIGITHQQIQKYEKGENRIACSRLAQIAIALDQPICEFLVGINDNIKPPSGHSRMCIEVSRNFLKIKNPKHKLLANDMVRRLANS